MVDRVSNGAGYGYSQIPEKKINTGASGAGEKFQLYYGKEGAIYEPSSEALKKQQEQNAVSKKNTEQPVNVTEDNGVRLSLSNTEGRLETDQKTKEGTEKSLIEVLTDIVNKAVATVKKYFDKIWNDEPKTENVPTEEIQETNEKEVAKPHTKFEQAKAEAEAFLASAEGKKAARNTDLLTCYDRHGTVVSVNPSDRQRILYGDKNQIEV